MTALALPAATGRLRTLGAAALAALLIAAIAAGSALVGAEDLRVNPAQRMLPPSAAHPFGTDMLGRDLALRSLAALGTSLWVGMIAAAGSTAIAALLALVSLAGRTGERVAGVLTELALGLPHLVLLLLIAYAMGGGAVAVTVAVAVTHWPRLSRVLRAELQGLLGAEFVQVSAGLGRSRGWIARHHLLPHLAPQMIVGFVLIFPHAILHEAALSFLGVGIEPHRPSTGMILSESLRALAAGFWWMGVLPGAALMAMAAALEVLGEGLRRALSPTEAQL